MENQQYHFGTFFWRITAAHMVTYMIMGMFAASLLDYQYIFDSSLMSCFYRPFNSPWIAAGPGLQIFRGLASALALWYFKESFLDKKYGWLKLWGLLVGLAILSTAGAAPGSIEGFIYTKIPVADQIIGYLEVVPQTGFFALFVCYWYENPKRIWNIISIVLVLLIVLMSFLGALASIGIIAVC